MTKIETVKSLVAVANAASTQAERQAAWEQVLEIKKMSKTSFNKLGIDEETLNTTIEAVSREDQVEVPVEQAAETPATTAKVREYALHLLNEAGDIARKDKIALLMDKLSITKFNAQYYVDRVAKGKK